MIAYRTLAECVSEDSFTPDHCFQDDRCFHCGGYKCRGCLGSGYNPPAQGGTFTDHACGYCEGLGATKEDQDDG